MAMITAQIAQRLKGVSMTKPGMMAMRRRRKQAAMFRFLVAERLGMYRSINDLIVPRDLPRRVAEQIVHEELMRSMPARQGEPR